MIEDALRKGGMVINWNKLHRGYPEEPSHMDKGLAALASLSLRLQNAETERDEARKVLLRVLTWKLPPIGTVESHALPGWLAREARAALIAPAEPREMTEDETVEFIRTGRRAENVKISSDPTFSRAVERLIADGTLPESHRRREPESETA